MVNSTKTTSEIGIAHFLIDKCAINNIPNHNSNPIRILASHSAMVQLKKVVSTMVQPNCSRVGILETAEKMKTRPIMMLNTLPTIFLTKTEFIQIQM